MLEAFQSLMLGFQVALSFQNIFFCTIGAFLGTLIGVLPGLGPAGGVAILLPITYSMDTTSALITMAGLYFGCMYGGSTTSILLNVPGEAASVVTCLDGYQMARKGRAGPALGMAAIASFIAGTFSVIMLTFISLPLVKVALLFGPPEYFSLTLMGLTLVTAFSGDSMIKGFISALFGLLVSCVGVDVISGGNRFTFGYVYLLDGINFICLAVGFFCVAEVLHNMEDSTTQVYTKVSLNLRSLFPNLQDWKDSIGPLWRGSLLGFFIGVLPGAGPTIASFISYGVEKKVSRHPEKFGTGIIEGIAGPEGANNAAAGGAFVPMLTLGIPGSGVTAILLGAMMLHGIRPGPMLFEQSPELVWGLIASMYIGNVVLVLLNLPLVGMWVSILRIPYKFLLPLIITIASVGIYVIEGVLFDLWVMLFFGVMGYFMKKLKIPAAPAILAVVLGPLLETSLKQSILISRGDYSTFFTKPISAFFIIVALLSVLAPLIQYGWRKMKNDRGKSA